MISIIAAIAENRAIGKNNQLLWHISDDLRRFKQLTSGHTVIMGRNTWNSLPVKPLPQRKNIIITNHPKDCFTGCKMVKSLDEALEECSPGGECFIIGGALVYRQFMPLAEKLYITRIDKPFDGDTFFPVINSNEWEIVEESEWFEMPDGSFNYRFENYERING